MISIEVKGPTKTVRMIMPENDIMTHHIIDYDRYYELDLLEAIAAMKLGGTYVDVGGCLGNHALFFAMECPSERILSYEPNPDNFKCLLGNILANDLSSKIYAFNMAIHDTARQVSVRCSTIPSDTHKGRSNMGGAKVFEEETDNMISARTLDEVVGTLGDISLIKIDVEGLDVNVLRSGMNIIKENKPVIAIEAPEESAQKEIADMLLPLGYKMVGKYCSTPTWLYVYEED